MCETLYPLCQAVVGAEPRSPIFPICAQRRINTAAGVRGYSHKIVIPRLAKLGLNGGLVQGGADRILDAHREGRTFNDQQVTGLKGVLGSIGSCSGAVGIKVKLAIRSATIAVDRL